MLASSADSSGANCGMEGYDAKCGEVNQVDDEELLNNMLMKKFVMKLMTKFIANLMKKLITKLKI